MLPHNLLLVVCSVVAEPPPLLPTRLLRSAFLRRRQVHRRRQAVICSVVQSRRAKAHLSLVRSQHSQQRRHSASLPVRPAEAYLAQRLLPRSSQRQHHLLAHLCSAMRRRISRNPTYSLSQMHLPLLVRLKRQSHRSASHPLLPNRFSGRPNLRPQLLLETSLQNPPSHVVNQQPRPAHLGAVRPLRLPRVLFSAISTNKPPLLLQLQLHPLQETRPRQAHFRASVRRRMSPVHLLQLVRVQPCLVVLVRKMSPLRRQPRMLPRHQVSLSWDSQHPRLLRQHLRPLLRLRRICLVRSHRNRQAMLKPLHQVLLIILAQPAQTH